MEKPRGKVCYWQIIHQREVLVCFSSNKFAELCFSDLNNASVYYLQTTFDQISPANMIRLCSALLVVISFSRMSDFFGNLQPLYLWLLLDEQDPGELWDSCFTSRQLYDTVTDFEQAEIDALWSDYFTDQELISTVMAAEQEKKAEQCA